MMYWSKDQSMMMMHYDYDVYDRKIRVWWWCFWSKDQNVMTIMIDRSEYDDDDVAADRKGKVLIIFLIERSKYWRCCCWSEGQGAEDVVVDRKVKMLKMLLIERTKCWRCCCWSKKSKFWRCCWSKGQNAEDVADRKVKVLMMMLSIEQSKCCCGSRLNMKTKDDVVGQSVVVVEDEDEDYMMLKSFQWFIDVSPWWWCWWCPPSPAVFVVDVVVEYPSR